jgi:hypothetical protein
VEPHEGGGASANEMAVGRDVIGRPQGKAQTWAGGGAPEEPDRGEEQEGDKWVTKQVA